MSARKAAPAKKAAKKIAAKHVEQVADLLPNARNPRKPWRNEKQRKQFLQSLQTFGDLSGIVFNRTTQQLVGGHKRVAEFKNQHSELRITEKLDALDACGTAAYGQVILADGTRFAYREVEWSKPKEAAANLAANKWSADWDMAGVSDLLAEVKDGGFELALTGFDDDELAAITEEFGEGGSSQGNGEGGDGTPYTTKITAPVYQITGENPPVSSLIDTAKSDKFISRINKAKIPDDIKHFLTIAARRHVVFDYSRIAEFYAHADAATQLLMEESALVIIDYDKAIENGYVALAEDLKTLYTESEGGDVDEA